MAGTSIMTAKSDDGRPLVNGRPILVGTDVLDCCKRLHVPIGDRKVADEIAESLNHLSFLQTQWAPQFSQLRKRNPSTLRMRRIARALVVLRADLPAVIDEGRKIKSDVDLSPTETLLDLVGRHQAIIDKFASTKGRSRSLAGSVASNIDKLLSKLCGTKRVSAKARDAFVSEAMKWLRVHKADAAVSRNRRRQRGSRRVI